MLNHQNPSWRVFENSEMYVILKRSLASRLSRPRKKADIRNWMPAFVGSRPKLVTRIAPVRRSRVSCACVCGVRVAWQAQGCLSRHPE